MAKSPISDPTSSLQAVRPARPGKATIYPFFGSKDTIGELRGALRQLSVLVLGGRLKLHRDDVLRERELETIHQQVTRINAYIKEIAAEHGFAVVDANKLFFDRSARCYR